MRSTSNLSGRTSKVTSHAVATGSVSDFSNVETCEGMDDLAKVVFCHQCIQALWAHGSRDSISFSQIFGVGVRFSSKGGTHPARLLSTEVGR